MIGMTSLSQLARLRSGVKSRRISSYDRKGGNFDWVEIAPDSRHTIGEIEGVGCIKHIWCTMWCDDPHVYRKVVMRMFWDGEEKPSVEVPIGDFFGLGHNMIRNFVSLPLQMSPRDGRGFNCWFPMPFQNHARLEIHNEATAKINYYYYINYEEYPPDTSMADYGRFHAQWRRVNPTPGWADPKMRWSENGEAMRDAWQTSNLTGENNYMILDAEGKGHYVGCHLDIDCLTRQANDWYGEGDDMIFIDGEETPRMYGTGTEDYFNTAFSPIREYCAPYHGIIVNEGTPDWQWRGKNSMYRYHIEDPIFFEESIKVTIEHGHANKLSNDYSSTAYWYQTEPHKVFPELLAADKRLPNVAGYGGDERNATKKEV